MTIIEVKTSTQTADSVQVQLVHRQVKLNLHNLFITTM
jgi:hypothetical protein